MKMATKFQKNSRAQVVSIPGTKPSIHNAQLLTSTGIPTLDSVIGGGIAVGSIILIEEDRYNIYSNLLFKLYLAEGINNEHLIHLISLDDDPSGILHALPTRHFTDEVKKEEDNEKLNIAWRYKTTNLSTQRNSQSVLRHDLNKFIEFSSVNDLSSFWNGDECELGNGTNNLRLRNPLFRSVINNIKDKVIDSKMLSEPNKTASNLLRIGIHSLLSPFWGVEYWQQEKVNGWNDVTLFLTLLKAIVRSSYTTVMITIPSHLISNKALMSRLYSIVDYAMKLESFQGSEKEINPTFQDYHGLLYIKKVASINTVVPLKIESLEWAFQLKKTGFNIKRLHLPPDLSETASRSSSDSSKLASSCKGEKLPKHLDF